MKTLFDILMEKNIPITDIGGYNYENSKKNKDIGQGKIISKQMLKHYVKCREEVVLSTADLLATIAHLYKMTIFVCSDCKRVTCLERRVKGVGLCKRCQSNKAVRAYRERQQDEISKKVVRPVGRPKKTVANETSVNVDQSAVLKGEY
jgi:ribosomal protein L37AE/L43A